MANITGTEGTDTITGTAGDDHIKGLGGSDTINAGAGDDIVEGGDGDDILDGQTGSDTLYGGAGDDWLYARDDGGTDYLYGGDGNDRLSLTRQSGTAFLDGGAGNDIITVQQFSGQATVDAGSVTVDAGSGNDIIRLWTGAHVTLGTGADTIDMGNASSRYHSTVTDFGSDDAIDMAGLLNSDTNWSGTGNPFATGHIRLVQNGNDTLVEVLTSSGYITSLTLQNVQASSLTASNFSGFAPKVAPPTAKVNAPVQLIEGETGELSITFFDVSTLNTTITVTATGKSTATGQDVSFTVGTYQISMAQAPAKDYTHSLGQITGLDDLLIEGLENLTLQITATGQVLEGFGSTANITVDILDNDLRGTRKDDVLNGDEGLNLLEGGAGNDTLTGFGGNDHLYGQAGNDILLGGHGNDILSGGRGNDVINGGEGIDTLLLDGKPSDYAIRRLADGSIQIKGFKETDTVRNIEQISFDSGRTTVTLAEFEQQLFDPYAYMVANPDIFRAYGINGTDAARAHYFKNGVREGRDTGSFDAMTYLASYSDLIRAFGNNTEKATLHYLNSGLKEGRTHDRFDALTYAASNKDLALAFGIDTAAATRHFVTHGYKEGRSTTSFDGLIYAASNADVAKLIGYDATGATQNYLTFGVKNGLATKGFDPLIYIASHKDLIRAFGTNQESALKHYLTSGAHEGRSTNSFNPLDYAASNTELARLFGLDAKAATLHYISQGSSQNYVTSGFDAVAYLLTYSDLAGMGSERALSHWLSHGADENRLGDTKFGREQKNHKLSAETKGNLEISGDRDWFETQLKKGDLVNFEVTGSANSVQLFDTLGNRITSVNGQFEIKVEGKYFVVVFGAAGSTGEFQLVTNVNNTSATKTQETAEQIVLESHYEVSEFSMTSFQDSDFIINMDEAKIDLPTKMSNPIAMEETSIDEIFSHRNFNTDNQINGLGAPIDILIDWNIPTISDDWMIQ